MGNDRSVGRWNILQGRVGWKGIVNTLLMNYLSKASDGPPSNKNAEKGFFTGAGRSAGWGAVIRHNL